MCHEIRAFIPALPLPVLLQDRQLPWLAVVQDVQDGSSTKWALMCFSFSYGECQWLQQDICAQFAQWTLQHKPALGLSAGSQWSDNVTGKSHAYIWNSATIMPMGSQGAILHEQHCCGKETGWCSEVVTEWHLRDQSLTWAQGSYSKRHHTGRSIFKHEAVLPRILLFQHTSWASQDQTYQWQLQLIS